MRNIAENAFYFFPNVTQGTMLHVAYIGQICYIIALKTVLVQAAQT